MDQSARYIYESDEVAAYQWRLAQARRMIRYCLSLGIDPAEVMAGRVQVDFSSISDADGKVIPEPVDVAAIASGRGDDPITEVDL